MESSYIVQPDQIFGSLLYTALEGNPTPRKVIIVSAFAGLQTVMRFKHLLAGIQRTGALVRIVVGIDMRGTSREVLQELLSWDFAEVIIYRNRQPFHTFHPKISILEWGHKSEIYVGSNNLTEGGFFRNYEAANKTIFGFPADLDAYTTAYLELARFIDPQPPLGLQLSSGLLEQLVLRNDLPTEAEMQQGRRNQYAADPKIANSETTILENPFGYEKIMQPPPLSAELLDGLVTAVSRRRRNRRRMEQPEPQDLSPALITPASFYMTLPKLQGPNIPGEARIPLPAIEMAEDFWGWPIQYTRDVSPRGGEERVYYNWKSRWNIFEADRPADSTTHHVRMYMYENSSDFRFYARPLVTLGADSGDIVRITRIDTLIADFECVVAKAGSAYHREWLKFCVLNVKNSPRAFGYG